MNRALLLLLLCAPFVPSGAAAAVLYKSISPTGVIEFSDQPPTDHSQVVESRTIGARDASVSAAASEANDGQPLYEDGALTRANAQLDLAEHALAEALRAIGSPLQGMRLSAARPSSADAQRIDFFRRNVTLARQNLMETLRSHQAPLVEAVASR
jgi:hypothetical protein